MQEQYKVGIKNHGRINSFTSHSPTDAGFNINFKLQNIWSATSFRVLATVISNLSRHTFLLYP